MVNFTHTYVGACYNKEWWNTTKNNKSYKKYSINHNIAPKIHDTCCKIRLEKEKKDLNMYSKCQIMYKWILKISEYWTKGNIMSWPDISRRAKPDQNIPFCSIFPFFNIHLYMIWHLILFSLKTLGTSTTYPEEKMKMGSKETVAAELQIPKSITLICK